MEYGALEHGNEIPQPYYPDVARMARELVRQSINALDPINVQKRLQRNRIKEESEPCGYDLPWLHTLLPFDSRPWDYNLAL